jgi:hypothetical protein
MEQSMIHAFFFVAMMPSILALGWFVWRTVSRNSGEIV